MIQYDAVRESSVPMVLDIVVLPFQGDTPEVVDVLFRDNIQNIRGTVKINGADYPDNIGPAVVKEYDEGRYIMQF